MKKYLHFLGMLLSLFTVQNVYSQTQNGPVEQEIHSTISTSSPTITVNESLNQSLSKEKEFIHFSHEECSDIWWAKNASLIPSKEQFRAILELDQDHDGLLGFEDQDFDNDSILNEDDPDIDGDQVANVLDPSPYDKREIGYYPFGVLEFFRWQDPWNKQHYGKQIIDPITREVKGYEYDEEKLEQSVLFMKEAGIRCVRIDFPWSELEPSKNSWDFAVQDKIVAMLDEHGIQVLGVMGYSPFWASSRKGKDFWKAAPINNEDFTQFVTATIKRYKNVVKYWEIWNEANSKEYWLNQDNMKTYSYLLIESYTQAKQIDPSCTVIMSGLMFDGYVDRTLESMYQHMQEYNENHNAKGVYFDIVNVHPFVDPEHERHLVDTIYMQLKQVMQKYGDSDKPVWFTEIGCPGVNNKSKAKWWKPTNANQEQQAQWINYLYSNMPKDVDKVYWAFFRDLDGHFRSGVDHFGLVQNNIVNRDQYGVGVYDKTSPFVKKKSFQKYQQMVEEWKVEWKKKSLKNSPRSTVHSPQSTVKN